MPAGGIGSEKKWVIRVGGTDIECFLNVSHIIEINNLGRAIDDMEGFGFSMMAVGADVDGLGLHDEHLVKWRLWVAMGQNSRPFKGGGACSVLEVIDDGLCDDEGRGLGGEDIGCEFVEIGHGGVNVLPASQRNGERLFSGKME